MTVPSNVGPNGNAPEIARAVEAAVADGMDVINLSLGEHEIEPSRDVLALALNAAAAAGVVPVASAGNSGDELGQGSVSSPASAARAIAVGAAAAERTSTAIASFSSIAPDPLSLRMKPDLVAPGVGILSSTPFARDGPRLVGRSRAARAWPVRTSRPQPRCCSSATRAGPPTR